MREIFPACELESLELLSKMLMFNPSKRSTVDELLADPYFNDVRKVSDVKPSPGVVDFPFEKKSWLSMVEIRKLVLEEIDYYKGLDDSRFDNLTQN